MTIVRTVEVHQAGPREGGGKQHGGVQRCIRCDVELRTGLAFWQEGAHVAWERDEHGTVTAVYATAADPNCGPA